jgi:hypothetical protein
MKIAPYSRYFEPSLWSGERHHGVGPFLPGGFYCHATLAHRSERRTSAKETKTDFEDVIAPPMALAPPCKGSGDFGTSPFYG